MQLLDVWKAAITASHMYVPVIYLGTASYEFFTVLTFLEEFGINLLLIYVTLIASPEEM